MWDSKYQDRRGCGGPGYVRLWRARTGKAVRARTGKAMRARTGEAVRARTGKASY